MRIFRLFAATLFIAAIAAALPAFAQQRGGNAAATTPPASSAPAQASGPVPASKIAFVNTQAFGNEKAGISRYIAAVKNLEREFKPTYDELTNINNRIQAIVKDIQQTQNVADPKALRTKEEEGERLQRELKFKKEDAEAKFQKRYEEVVGPVSNDIGKALDAFAKQRGITTILDLSKQAILESVLTIDPSMDVTAAFIADFNSKNPATASTAAPGR